MLRDKINIADLPTPCYVADLERFGKNVQDLIEAYRKYYRNFKFGYSYKTNYYEPFLRHIHFVGQYAEVVSPKEYELAKSIGVEDKDIIFNGVIPAPELKAQVARNGGIVNIDNYAEFEELVIKHGVKSIGVRVAFDVNGLSTRFGFHILGTEYKKMKILAKTHGVEIKCVHCHISKARDSESFYTRIVTMISVAKELRTKIIDIGGNMFGRIEDENFRKQFQNYCTYEEYGYVVGSAMKRAFPNEDVLLIAEGGTPVVSDTMSIVLSVIGVKTELDDHFVIVDGKTTDVGFACMYKQPPYRHYGKKGGVIAANVVGCSCIENDYILRDYVGPAHIGDKIVIDNIGACSSNLVNDFISNGCRAFYDVKEIDYGKKE